MQPHKKVIILNKDSEADTCRKEVLPKIYASGWTDEQILQERYFTKGKVVVIGRKASRKKGKRFDYLLRYSTNFPIAVVEAKVKYKTAGDGMQQAKEYAEIIGLQFAYATNGQDILEYDFGTGMEREITAFPTPQALYNRLKQASSNPTIELIPTVEQSLAKLEEKEAEATTPDQITYHHLLSQKESDNDLILKPFYPISNKPPRYYQNLAVNRSIKALLEGKKRLLLCMATGTGKTTVAFQIMYKLWNNRWNLEGKHRHPKVMFLADRTVLIDDPYIKDFEVFGNARWISTSDDFSMSRDIYFTTYQAIAADKSRPGLYKLFARDFFDLIVVDECHRGSAADDSNWRMILEYFDSAVQLGLTATPLRKDNRDTYLYFGNPIYTYTLKQGIEDGFLAPYLVHRVVSSTDATGYTPQKGETDKYGREIPDELYSTPDFEKTLSHLPRTKAIARHLTDFMYKNGRYKKTIVFCVDSEHADDMRRELNNLNTDINRLHSNYIVRVVSKEGERGKGFLGDFMDPENETPVIVTTSKMLSTGVDIPDCHNIAIVKVINSMTEFKQIVGRGTRIWEGSEESEKAKLFFTILDYTGSATRQFKDKQFDGLPPMITEDEIDEKGKVKNTHTENNEEESETEESTNDASSNDDDSATDNTRRKYYVVKGDSKIVAESVQVLDSTGKLRTIEYRQYAKRQIRLLFPDLEVLQNAWNNLAQRHEVYAQLSAKNIDLEQLAKITQLPECDSFDLLCFIAFDLQPKTRKQRADLFRKNKTDFFAEYSEKAQQILQIMLDKYVEFGLKQLEDTQILTVQPITRFGNVMEIAEEFGGTKALRRAIKELQILLYAA